MGPDNVIDAVHSLQIHRYSLYPIGDFTADRVTLEPADLLEVGELSDFHAVEPDLPAQTPGPQCRRFPVVFNKANVVHRHINAQTAKRIKIQLLNVFWRRFQDDLKLIVMLQPVGVFAVAAVRRSPAGLHVGGVPALRPDGSEKSRG